MHSMIFFILASMAFFYGFVSLEKSTRALILCFLFMVATVVYGATFHDKIKQEFKQVGEHKYTPPCPQKNK